MFITLKGILNNIYYRYYIYLFVGENKITIKKRLIAEKQNPLLELEKWATEFHYVRRQVGFCAQWCLDNLCKYYNKICVHNYTHTYTHMYTPFYINYINAFIYNFLVLMEGRKYSHDAVDMTGINVMLNTKDVSEYLKISPNGLEVVMNQS